MQKKKEKYLKIGECPHCGCPILISKKHWDSGPQEWLNVQFMCCCRFYYVATWIQPLSCQPHQPLQPTITYEPQIEPEPFKITWETGSDITFKS
jgi:hypothetical protein